MHRRRFVQTAAGAALAGLCPVVPAAPPSRLTFPELIDTRSSGRFELVARGGRHAFGCGLAGDTVGFSADFLGPVVRVAPGETAVAVRNRLGEAVSCHWHGLAVPGDVDGGPHQQIAPGETWNVVLPIDQPPMTGWFHSHIHERTAVQVHAGLAGVVQVSDGRDDARGLPAEYGVDDLMLIVQDRRFSGGSTGYAPGMHDVMQGYLGDTITVNGQIGAAAAVPAGIVRLRVLNASNARIYRFAMASGRPLHLVGTDSGLLPAPIALEGLPLAPGERAELLVDFGSGGEDRLVADTVANGPMMGGMMGGMMGADVPLESPNVVRFVADGGPPARHRRLPDRLDGRELSLGSSEAEVFRELSLTMGHGMGGGMRGGGMGRMGGMMGGRGMMGGGMGGRGMGPGMMGGFGIDGRPFDMSRIDLEARGGRIERWRVRSEMMQHPFHVHGVSFLVAAVSGGPVPAHLRGWKDTVLVDGEVDLLMRFDHRAGPSAPYMFHCHILEHEDAGMMGQFTVV